MHFYLFGTLVWVQGNKMLGWAVFQALLGPKEWGQALLEVPCIPGGMGGLSEESRCQDWIHGGVDGMRVNTGSRRKEMFFSANWGLYQSARGRWS